MEDRSETPQRLCFVTALPEVCTSSPPLLLTACERSSPLALTSSVRGASWSMVGRLTHFWVLAQILKSRFPEFSLGCCPPFHASSQSSTLGASSRAYRGQQAGQWVARLSPGTAVCLVCDHLADLQAQDCLLPSSEKPHIRISMSNVRSVLKSKARASQW